MSLLINWVDPMVFPWKEQQIKFEGKASLQETKVGKYPLVGKKSKWNH